MMEKSAQSTIAAKIIHEYIMQLPPYVAGKASQDSTIIKVASNEMPFPTLPSVQAEISSHISSLNRYPDAAMASLTARIAQEIGMPEESLCIGNGSVALIEKILADVSGPGSEVIIPWRSFEAYPIAVQMAGAETVCVPLRADGNCDLTAMLAAVTPTTRAIIVCTPNNPTSAALTHNELHDFIQQAPKNVPILLDEAYIDFVRMEDPVRAMELMQEFPNVLCLRTFSKAYGLAGLRCGYVVAEPSIARALNSSNTPFSVNTLAQVAAQAALGERAEVNRRVGIIQNEREKLVTALRSLGWNGPEPQANFVWFELGKHSQAFEKLCSKHGIIVRTFKNEGTRVTIAEPEASQRLIAAYEEWIHQGGGDDE